MKSFPNLLKYIRFIYTIFIVSILCQIIALIGATSNTTGLFAKLTNDKSYLIMTRLAVSIAVTIIYACLEFKFYPKCTQTDYYGYIDNRYRNVTSLIYYIVFAFVGFLFTINFISRKLLFIYISSFTFNSIHGLLIYLFMYRKKLKYQHTILYIPITCLTTALLVYIYGSLASDIFYRYFMPTSF